MTNLSLYLGHFSSNRLPFALKYRRLGAPGGAFGERSGANAIPYESVFIWYLYSKYPWDIKNVNCDSCFDIDPPKVCCFVDVLPSIRVFLPGPVFARLLRQSDEFLAEKRCSLWWKLETRRNSSDWKYPLYYRTFSWIFFATSFGRFCRVSDTNPLLWSFPKIGVLNCEPKRYPPVFTARRLYEELKVMRAGGIFWIWLQSISRKFPTVFKSIHYFELIVQPSGRQTRTMARAEPLRSQGPT